MCLNSIDHIQNSRMNFRTSPDTKIVSLKMNLVELHTFKIVQDISFRCGKEMQFKKLQRPFGN